MPHCYLYLRMLPRDLEFIFGLVLKHILMYLLIKLSLLLLSSREKWLNLIFAD